MRSLETASLASNEYAASAKDSWAQRIPAVLIGLLVVKNSLSLARHFDNWYIGDWLINYAGGFVRRGLPGEAALLLARATHIPVIWIAVAASILLYLAFLSFSSKLITGQPRTVLVLLLALSPAAATFEVLNPNVGIRKEVLLFAAMAFLAASDWIQRVSPRVVAATLSLALLIMGLSHEGLLLFSPYLFCLILIRRQDKRSLLRFFLVPIAVASVTFAAAALYTGNLHVASAVCQSIGPRSGGFGSLDTGVCGGSIAYLQTDSQANKAVVQQLVQGYHYVAIYSCYALLSALPVLLAIFTLRKRSSARENLRILIALASLTVVFSVPLFLRALDWGRWIHIHVTCIALILLVLLRDHLVSEPALPARTASARIRLAATAVFLTSWVLPVTISRLFHPVFGYYGFVEEQYSHLLLKIRHHDGLPTGPTARSTSAVTPISAEPLPLVSSRDHPPPGF